ncbi:MAG: sugar ABC transporter permease [Anaerolineae bacterium]|nr:sugar ABC transporter permease [Anaerolineae bacterium]
MSVAVLFFMVWTFLPLGYAFVRSFYDWQPTAPSQRFLGVANYREALFADPLFWRAAKNTLAFTLANVCAGTILCLSVALMINAVSHGGWATLFRVSYFLPHVASLAAVALVWQFIYQPRFGLLNACLRAVAGALYLPPPEIGWLTRPQWAMTSVIIMHLWKNLGFRTVIYLAGLQDIPESLYDAAKIDGAGRWAQIRAITLPLLAPSLALTTVMSTIGSLQVFAQVFMMTRGGPMHATLTVVYLIYQEAFEIFRFGYAAAVSFILFSVILVLTVIQMKLLQPRFEY